MSHLDGEDTEDDESLFKILMATDIHLGCFERDPVRGNDSFVAFEEILQYTREREVDMLLLGGDLFHENKPSRQSVQRCMDLLRKYCLGPKEVKFEFLSDPEIIFKDCSTPGVNIEDPNLSIALPIFSINGNHDDPCGEGNYSIMDMLGASGFVNYFGKMNSVKELRVQPLLLRKGETHLAIYGIGSMNDDRLCRLFNEEKVTFERPVENEDNWFNLMVLHQNRSRHGAMNYVPEKILPEFFQLVFWGHEHECRLGPEPVEDYYITQPGSSVVTALSPGEAVPKHVGLLHLKRTEFFIEALPLRTSRPFIFDTLSLGDIHDDGVHGSAAKKVFNMAVKKVEQMIQESKTKISGHPAQPHLPLIRLRIEYENKDHMFNMKELEVKLQLEKRVANPEDVVRFTHKRSPTEKIDSEIDQDAWLATLNLGQLSVIDNQLEDFLVKYYESTKKPLTLLHEKSLAEAVNYYVEKEHSEAFQDIINFEVQKPKAKVTDLKPQTRDQFRKLLSDYREERSANPQLVTEEAQSVLKGEVKLSPSARTSLPAGLSGEVGIVDLDDESGDQGVSISPIAAPTRGRGRGRGSRAPAATPRARARGGSRKSGAKAVEEVIELESDEDYGTAATQAKRGRGRGRAARRPPSSSAISAAFARQSQMAAATTQASNTRSTGNQNASSSSRGKMYVSDSD